MACNSIVLFLLSTILSAQDYAQVYGLGKSHHGTWDEEGTPNENNYGLGLGYAWGVKDFVPTVKAYTEFEVLVYNDSFGNPSVVTGLGFSLRRPIGVIIPELGAGLSYWNSTKVRGVFPLWYAGVGYRLSKAYLFVEGSYDPTQQLSMAWLKLSIPVN